jgi:NAD(P)-dependent dehydrogenase (short-subunit alcohol dehydrogenase family)
MSTSRPVAIVTGGARRIGRAIVEDLAAHGWAVAIHCNRSRSEGESLAADLRARGGQAAVVAADLGLVASAERIVAGAEAALGKSTLLVNNASLFEADAVGTLDSELWQRQMTVNLTAPVFLAQAFVARLPGDAEGNIVNIIDQSVWKPMPRNFSYQVSKSALWTATIMMAQAFAPRVRVNAIGPGPTLPNSRQTAEGFRRQTAALLLERPADLAEFGRTVRYFVENRSITGQMIALDGGRHLAWQTPEVAEPDATP